MHEYVSALRARRGVYLVLAVVSLLLAYGVHWLQVTLNVLNPWWFDVPSGLGFFPALHLLFDRWMWRLPVLHWLAGIPDLRGNWATTVRTSHDHHETTHEATIVIEQTWTRISIVLEGTDSRSESFAAAMLLDGRLEPVLHYLYRNEPKSHAKETMVPHRGAVEMLIRHGGQEMEGNYFTGRARRTDGSIHMRKVSLAVEGDLRS